MRLVLYEPDIPQNAGTMMRLAAALGVAVDLIEPCGFLVDDRRLRRAAMDYADFLDLTRWTSWRRYAETAHAGRLVLLTTRASQPYAGFAFATDDRIMVGRESAGVPEAVHAAADARIVIPLRPEARSINVATAAAMVLGEAIRQTGAGPRGP
ncbi:tRNA (cytidine/uridine-2'-O-)-methyltransferase [Inquilinus ginsengisoli]|jgi:tRNA (cytidine/uridine-2'-O-)-methyltransferase|uniref:tRNA (cytidine(34)-2'-O)-methyltransferase n=1 Tax=Inquilinus ginsengisoli TaxID=363840 RepID=UPI003D23100C